MSLKNKLFTGLTVAGAVFAFSTFTMAQDATKPDSDNTQKREWRKDGKRDGMGKGFRRGGFGMRGLRELNLTDAQKTQIRTIMETNRPAQNSFEEMKALRDAKRNGTLTDAQKEQLKTLREERRAKAEQVQAQILAVLTPEQRQQLEAKKAEMQKLREERKQQRRERRQQNPQTEDQDN